MDSFPTPPLVRQLIEEARAAGVAHLDLSADTLGFALPAFPPELLDLPGLRTLDFHGHALQSLPPTLERLAGLESLDLRRNPIRRLPDVALPPLIIDTLQWHHLAGQLGERVVYGLHILREDLGGETDFLAEVGRRGMRWLSLRAAWLTEVPGAIWDLTNLVHLDLGDNRIARLPDGIGRLRELTELDFGGNQISELPEALCLIKYLKRLNFSDNELTELPEVIGRLRALTDLYLSRNKIAKVAAEIGLLQDLSALDLANNLLVDLPKEVAELQKLTSLDLSHNPIANLPAALKQLKSLIHLSLSHNEWGDMTCRISRIPGLVDLDLSHNKLNAFGVALFQQTGLVSLDLDDQALKSHLSYGFGISNDSMSREKVRAKQANYLLLVAEKITRFFQLKDFQIGAEKVHDPAGIIGSTIISTSILPGDRMGDLRYVRNESINLALSKKLRGASFDNFRKFQELSSLNLAGNQLRELSLGIKQLRGLMRLDLSGNRLTGAQEILGSLQGLAILSLEDNRLNTLPEALAKLNNLVGLNLSRNRLAELLKSALLPQGILDLNLADNQLTEFPNVVSGLHGLTSISLSGNRLTRLPAAVTSLKYLTKLDLRYNQLADLPDDLDRLRGLTSLSLSMNKIQDLPEALGKLDYLYSLDLDGQRLSDGLQAAYDQDVRAVLRYLRSKGPRLYEAKLLILGEGGVGKTTLARKLLDPAAPLPREDESTLGINVHRDWSFPWARDPTVQFSANIWDFGGQEIQYATHQFFLTPNALYVLVADPRRQETDYDYWLKVIRLLGEDRAGGRRSSVLVLLHEKGGRQVSDFDLGEYRRRFPELALETMEADLANLDDGRLEAVRQRVQRMLSDLPHVGERQPAAWQQVRAAIEARREEHHLSFERFVALCADHGLADEGDARTLARFLSFVGTCVYFDRDPELKDFIVIDPQWAVNALYRVLDRDEVQRACGRLRRSFFSQVLAAEGYREGQIDRLFMLLERERFEICFPVEDNDREIYIVPQLLPGVAPDYDWDSADNLHFEYQYPFMPKGLLSRFIVRLYPQLAADADGGPLVWRTGAVLRLGRARAEMRETEDRRGGKVLRIRISGPTLDRRQLLAVLRHEIAVTHARSFRGLEVHERVPCNCPVCAVPGGVQGVDAATHPEPRMYDYGDLAKLVGNGRGTVCCADGNADVSIAGLLEGLVNVADARRGRPPVLTGEDPDLPGLTMVPRGLAWELDRLPAGDFRSLAVLLLAALDLRPPAPPQTVVELHLNNSAHAEAHQSVRVDITIEQKVQACAELAGVLAQLAEDAPDAIGDPAELKRLTTELEKTQKALATLEQAQDPKASANKGALARVKGLIDRLNDGSESIRKLINHLEGGAGYAGRLVDLYNQAAPWFGWLPVPNPFKSKTAAGGGSGP